MSATLLRLGLWTLILALAAYVVAAANPDQSWAELIHTSMLQQLMVLGLLLMAAGIVLRILGKGKDKVVRNRCKVCRTPISSGAIYCREHLRTILADEDERTHATHVRR